MRVEERENEAGVVCLLLATIVIVFTTDFHKPLQKIGGIGAERGWRKTACARSVEDAEALIAPRLFRTIGISAVGAAVRLVRDDLGQSLPDNRRGRPERASLTPTSSRPPTARRTSTLSATCRTDSSKFTKHPRKLPSSSANTSLDCFLLLLDLS